MWASRRKQRRVEAALFSFEKPATQRNPFADLAYWVLSRPPLTPSTLYIDARYMP